MNSSAKPRLRLAPSPTGFLHLGNLRTALFTYLLAKNLKGSFILRIEDTDEKRYVEGSIESLVRVFKNLGIEFDEGPDQGGNYGPYIQSQRLDIYKQYAEGLVAKGEAYYCFATAEELEQMRIEQTAKKMPPRYDGRYRDYSPEEALQRVEAGEAHVIRHKMPLEGDIIARDELRGEITFAASQIEDYVLLKSDGYPTYQLASVIDDHLMGITHVTRGEEWLPSLPKNITLYKSFDWTPPLFIHLPLILNASGGKLSKRQGDVYVEDFLNKGYLPEALINFCALLGWHPKNDQELFSLKELEKSFSLEGVGISPAVFDQAKLDYLNGYYIRELVPKELIEKARPFLSHLLSQTPAHKREDAYISSVLALEQPRLKLLSELPENVAFFFENNLTYDVSLLVWKKCTAEQTKENLIHLLARLEEWTGEWKKEALETMVIDWLKQESKNLGDYLWPMRVALSGRRASPGPFEIAEVIGQDETLEKLKKAIGQLG